MPTLNWSDEMNLGVAAMDAAHREFVALLTDVENAGDAQLMPLWRQLVEHTQEHFDAENRYMAAARFFATRIHTTHHQMVLRVLRDSLEKGEPEPIRQLARELATWFERHASTMDTALAKHLLRVEFDPASGTIGRPDLLPAGPEHDCSDCSDCSECGANKLESCG